MLVWLNKPSEITRCIRNVRITWLGTLISVNRFLRIIVVLTVNPSQHPSLFFSTD